MVQKRPDRTLGPGHDTFWEGCAQGVLHVQRCAGCGELTWPVVAACDHCGSTELVWNVLSGAGKVISWCSFEQDYYRGMIPVPYDTVLVELAEGPLFIANPDGFTREDTVFEMPVQVAFIDCEDSAGAFKLPVFRKA